MRQKHRWIALIGLLALPTFAAEYVDPDVEFAQKVMALSLTPTQLRAKAKELARDRKRSAAAMLQSTEALRKLLRQIPTDSVEVFGQHEMHHERLFSEHYDPKVFCAPHSTYAKMRSAASAIVKSSASLSSLMRQVLEPSLKETRESVERMDEPLCPPAGSGSRADGSKALAEQGNAQSALERIEQHVRHLEAHERFCENLAAGGK